MIIWEAIDKPLAELENISIGFDELGMTPSTLVENDDKETFMDWFGDSFLALKDYIKLLHILMDKTSVINLVKNTKNVYEYNKETLNSLMNEDQYNFIKLLIEKGLI